MIILFGFRRKLTRLATVFVMCGHCNTPAAHALTRTRRYFTLFFVPVIAFGTKYFTTCTMCGYVTRVTKEGADHYLAAAAQAANVSAPTPTAPAAPLVPPAPEAIESPPFE
jgi:hypothetical protein